MSLLASLLKRSGRTIEDLRANSNVGRLVRKGGVRPGVELSRIEALPRRVWESDPELPKLVLDMTDWLREPNGKETLRPVQAVILKELHDYGGCMGVARVGSGKTIISALAPVVLDAERPLYLGPAKLMSKTQKEFRRLADHWRVCRTYNFLSYEKLSNVKYYAEYLERLCPDFICFEEGHCLKNPRSVRSKVLKAYLKKHPGTRCLNLTGTWQRNSVKDGAHISDWCLKELSPFPRVYHELEEWSEALDEKVQQRLPAGALTRFCPENLEPDLDTIRAAVGRRVTQTPGFVTVQSSDCDCLLSIQGDPFNDYPPEMDDYFQRLRESWETPNGEAFSEPIQLWNYLRQCQTGFYYYLDPAPPEQWKLCRRAWAGFVREILKNNKVGLLSEWQVANACSRGLLDSYGIYAKWKEIKPLYDPEKHRKTAWFGDAAMNWCAGWLARNDGILFTPYVAVGNKLKDLTGLPYFAAQGVDKKFGAIDDFQGGACIASIAANREGRNLQRYNKALLVGGIGNASAMEQLLGRLHRSGQKADEVVFDVFYGCIEALQELHQAKREALYARDMNQDEAHKLLVADFLLASEEEAEKWTGPRWVKAA